MVPFRVSTDGAKEFLKTIAVMEVMPRVMSKWDMLKHQLLSLVGITSMSDPEEKIVKLERMTALYLPIWLVDASFEVKCRGNDGRAESNFITTSSRFPGHSWKPMDTMPMFPPPPYDMSPKADAQNDPSLGGDAPKATWNNLSMVDYESYQSYLKRMEGSKVKIEGGIPDPLPFTISPLCLPDMLRNQLELKDLTFKQDLAAGVPIPGAGVHGLGLTIALVNEEGEQITAPPVRFEPDTLQLDMFAAYPILMPLHMAEYSYVDQETEERQHITFVLGAWDTNGLQMCSKEQGEDWNWTFTDIQPLKIDVLDMYPRVPVRTSLNEMFDKKREAERKALAKEAEEADEEANKASEKDGERKPRKSLKEWEDEWDRQDAAHDKQFKSELRSRMMEKLSSELPLKASVQERSLELLQRADWQSLERVEQDAYEQRIAKPAPPTVEKKARKSASQTPSTTAPTEPRPFEQLYATDRAAERDHPDRKAGLGDFIYWSSPHVQRLSHNVYANRRYLTEAIPPVLESRKRMASIEEGGYDVDRSLLKVERKDGSKLSGKEAYNTLAADDLSVRQQREALKPRWLKALEEARRN
uniref:Uncharacterized protein n=2 Tax=Kalmanozyma brasiliensis (strain GHG001) TaxID=1365824 RepID=V5ESB1_KALBG